MKSSDTDSILSIGKFERVFRPLDCSTLVCFRAAFGALLLGKTCFDWSQINGLFPPGEFRASYPLLEFMQTWSAPPMSWVFACMLVGSFGLMAGLLTRPSALLFALSFGYAYLLDPTRFNNHDYLITLLALWFIVVRSSAGLSLDAWIWPRLKSQTIPAWHLGIFVFHVCLVYFMGGVNKLNADWLRGEPMSVWLAVEKDAPLIGPLLASKWAGVAFAWAGMIFDLCIPFLLLYRKTRPYALALTVAFHLTNSQLFEIGVFPWLMLAANILFLPPSAPRNFALSIKKFFGPEERRRPKSSAVSPSLATPIVLGRHERLIVALLGLYLAFHVLMPFRPLLYPGDVEWNEQGKNFSWRMMLSHKDTFVGIRIIDHEQGFEIDVDQRKHLTPRQMRGKGVWGNPRVLAQYARFLKREAEKLGIKQPDVRVHAVAALNGRPFQFLVDPDVNLAEAESPLLGTPDWIVPLEQNQPIGNYAMTHEELEERVMRVIHDHQARTAAELSAAQSLTKG